jgi:hypothetical protein
MGMAEAQPAEVLLFLLINLFDRDKNIVAQDNFF